MLNLISIDFNKIRIDTLVIPVCEDKDIHTRPGVLSIIKKAAAYDDFKGRKDEDIIFYNPSGINAERIILLGIGKFEKIDVDTFRSFSGRAIKLCIKKKIKDAALMAPAFSRVEADAESVVTAMAEGAILGNHIFDVYKSEKKDAPVSKIDLISNNTIVKKYRSLIEKVETVCEGTIMARDWVSTPPNDKRPEQFIEQIAQACRKEELDVTVMNSADLKKGGFNAILAVAAGSLSKPGMAVISYSPETPKQTIAFVGKGVTFDSGGINLKPGGSSSNMKIDMAGAAAVAATLITTARLKPDVQVIGVIPLVENMPSGNAARPGDIIRAYSGKTVEILNTDAEGRLILIDALAYVVKTYKPDIVIDIATLTGACLAALGENVAGVFSSDDELAEALVRSGRKTFERCWRLPIVDDYREKLKSDVADIKNVGDTGWGGAIIAALFLSEFVKDAKWAHLDIAGPAYVSKAGSYVNPGGTGFGVRLFCDLLSSL